jgi:hypothetical protein
MRVFRSSFSDLLMTFQDRLCDGASPAFVEFVKIQADTGRRLAADGDPSLLARDWKIWTPLAIINYVASQMETRPELLNSVLDAGVRAIACVVMDAFINAKVDLAREAQQRGGDDS